ncbi:4Fe-4S binding protein [Tropicibacter oceani]|uniref:4Fe-4S binding protein n=1 Tax=Tropicibacter oceani TaxID=3058420 RepID=A0ABY8QLM7_9RHOB|nr:4Fe-4S binding protein [Tropicibacter oceani]WGW05550.1 4Fe-4S binding protein [Tropicibacter oceani]
MTKRILTCSCEGSMRVDAARLAEMTGLEVAAPCHALCTDQLDKAAADIAKGDLVICCGQETRLFESLAEDVGADAPAFVDLRDRAGWHTEEADATPKMAALLAEGLLPAAPGKALDVISEGLCLILGAPDMALAAAEQLKDFLGVTVLLERAEDMPVTRGFDVVVGRLRGATGALGGFSLRIDALQQMQPGGRGGFSLGAPRDGAVTDCDIILDLRGGTPLFSAHEKREGYLRPDPGNPGAVSAAILAASHMVGTFEKPLYIKLETTLCAHSRAEQTGCTRCLDLCPTGAITPMGDHVSVDPMVCAGCGACSAACPSGAISYDAPPVDLIFRRVQTLAKAYLEAGGTAPRLLVVNNHGAEMIRLAARFGDGLPADVIPLEVAALNGFGHAEIVAALGAGFASVTLVPSQGTDRDALEVQLALATAIGGAGSARMLDTPDPDALTRALYDETAPAPVAQPVRPMGTRRQITRQAARALHPGKDSLPLPDGAPYGAVLVDTGACTLCLSCVSLCPSGALGDNPDLPQLRFQEDACLQCGLCANICPEDAITFEPRLNLADAALSQVILNEEEPFACIECGSLFGVKSTIEKITAKLENHSMFAGGDKLRMIQMCDNCRVNAQYHSDNNPFKGADRPKVRTTEDYLSKRKDH